VQQHCAAAAGKATQSSFAPFKNYMFQEPLNRALHVARWVALAIVVGVFSGILSAAFIESLDWATDTRIANDWLLYTLPLCGLLVAGSFHYLGRGLERGNNLVIEQIHEHSEWIPFRLTPLIFFGSFISHLGGGSAGREGAAVQLAAGVTDSISKKFKFGPVDRQLMLITAIAAGFGSIAGVPLQAQCSHLKFNALGVFATKP
jgi:H+/Cl- antiporter ClcA